MRSNLRNTLLNHVPPDQVRYSSNCMSAVPAAQEGQAVQLRFADESSAECDLLVVADGANSRIRTALMPHEQNRYAGLCMLFVSPWAVCIHTDTCQTWLCMSMRKSRPVMLLVSLQLDISLMTLQDQALPHQSLISPVLPFAQAHPSSSLEQSSKNSDFAALVPQQLLICHSTELLATM